MTTTPKTLFDFMTAEEQDRLRELSHARSEARQEVSRIHQAMAQVDAELASIPHLRVANAAAAAARYLGETDAGDKATEPTPLADPNSLRDAITGLKRRLEEAEASVRDAEGAYRHALTDELLDRCLKRASEEYVLRTRALVETWTVMDSAMAVATGLDPTGMRAVLGNQFWGNLRIPGTDAPSLPSLANATLMTSYGPLIFDGKDARERGLTRKAIDRLANQVRLNIGEWPFDRRG